MQNIRTDKYSDTIKETESKYKIILSEEKIDKYQKILDKYDLVYNRETRSLKISTNIDNSIYGVLRWRAKEKMLLWMFSVIAFLFSFIGAYNDLNTDYVNAWGWVVAIISAIIIIYLIFFFDKLTVFFVINQIKYNYGKAVEEIKMHEEINFSRYDCKYIQNYLEFRKGTCDFCGKREQELQLCKIRNKIDSRTIYLCGDCIRKFTNHSSNPEKNKTV